MPASPRDTYVVFVAGLDALLRNPYHSVAGEGKLWLLPDARLQYLGYLVDKSSRLSVGNRANLTKFWQEEQEKTMIHFA